MNAGVALIAERGFDAVTVGEIEAAAGFVARGGTLYKHFSSKNELLEQAMQRHVDSLENLDDLDQFHELPDLRSELVVLGHWILTRLTREEQISKIIEKEGHRIPAVVDAMRNGVSEPGYAMTAAYLLERGLATDWDHEALAVLLLGGLVNLRRSTWTFRHPPSGVNDERAVATWAELCARLVEGQPRPSTTETPLAETRIGPRQ